MAFNDEQLRHLANAQQFYDSWKEVAQQLAQLPGGLYWKVINSREYLYKYVTEAGIRQVTSLGPKSPETEAKYEEFTKAKTELEDRRKSIEATLNERAPILRALRLPSIDTTAAKILRKLDQLNVVGKDVLVVGTYALPAYEVEAQTPFAAGINATEDLDFTLFLGQNADPDLPRRLLLAVKHADPGFIVSFTSPKTVTNKAGYHVDLLMSNAAASSMSAARPWKPEALEGQEWLVLGRPVHTLLIDYQGWPVAVSVPDPRYFALHKLWLSERRNRSTTKATKDRRQGITLLKALKEHLPHYPLDEDFIAGLPKELKAQLKRADELASQEKRKPPRSAGNGGR